MQFGDKCLKEMFKRVGLEYPNKELTSQDDWYHKHTWTTEQDNDFRAWLTKAVKNDNKFYSARQIESQVELFLLQWGWRIEDKETGSSVG